MAIRTLAVVALAAAGAAAPADATRLVPGQHVKVEGRTTVDGVFTTEQVTLRDTDTSAKVEGAIARISPDRKHLQMVGFTVTVQRSTRIYRGSQPSASRSLLAAGAWIEAKGTWRDGLLRATRIRVKDAPEATEEIEGFIEQAASDGSSVTILGRRVVIPPGVSIVDERSGRPMAPPGSRLRRDDDDGEGRPLEIGNLVLGGRLEAGFVEKRNFDQGGARRDRTAISRAQVLASSQLTDRIEAYAKASVTRSMAAGSVPAGAAELSEAYLLLHELGGSPVDLQIGRQRFRDAREWFFDEYLDAARIHVAMPAVKVEAAITQGLFAAPRELRRRRDQLQFILSASTRLRGPLQFGVFAIARQDVTRGERPAWLGGSVRGRLRPAWTYWADAATRRGSSRTAALRGWAFDAGTTRRWPLRWSPSVTAGYAAASGDATRGDRTDTRFRQTDLEDNQSYYGGLRRLANYGEVFDPELTNLHVATVGVGVRPRPAMTVDAIYHRFRQAVASSSNPSGNVEGRLTGTSRRLGGEVDLVMTIRALPGLDVDLAAGVFLPGRAFAETAGAAFFWRPQLRIYF